MEWFQRFNVSNTGSLRRRQRTPRVGALPMFGRRAVPPFLLAMRRYLLLGMVSARAITLAFIAFNMGFGRVWFGLFPAVTLNGSVGYLPALMALVAVGFTCLMASKRQAGYALLWAGCIFGLSLVFRSIDSAFCPTLPLGTHAVWHMLNALVLWILMITGLAHAPGGKAV